MRALLACTFVAVLGLAITEARPPHCTLRAHAEANIHDGAPFATQVQSAARGREIAIEKVPTISERDVVAFRAYPAADGSFGALFELNDHGKLALDTLSLERRGTFLHVFVDGRPTAELQIDRRVADGRLYIASGLTAADIETMRKEWPPRRERTKRS